MPRKKSNLSRKTRDSRRAAESRKRKTATDRALQAEKRSILCAQEAPAQRTVRLAQQAERMAAHRAQKTPAQRAAYRALEAEKKAISRARETPTQRAVRRAKDAMRKAALRAKGNAKGQEIINYMHMKWDSFKGSTKPLRKKLRLTNVQSISNVYKDDLLIPTWVEAADGDVTHEFIDSKDFSIVYDCNDGGEDPLLSNPISSTVKEEKADPLNDMMYPDSNPNTPENKYFEFCVHCCKHVPRIVHHYVNEHPGSEVYTSRIRAKDLIRVLTTENLGTIFTYKNGQIQYDANCIFCNKECKVVMLPYWFEHFKIHTGEYSYKCSACDTLKPTRSLVTNHTANQCTSKGSIVRKYIFEVCTICNYLQMDHKNVVRHLKTQHEIETILPEHVQTVVVMQTVSIDNPNCRSTATAVIPKYLLPQSIDSGGGGGGGVSDQSVSAQSWAATNPASVSSTSLENFNSTSTFFNDVDADYTYYDCGDDDDDGDDLSYMICGMLDVATNDVNQTLDMNRRGRV